MNFVSARAAFHARRTICKSAIAALLLGAWLLSPATAQDKSPITVVQVAPLEGPIGTYARSIQDGMAAYFQWTNAHGGIRGQKIELVGVDIPIALNAAGIVQKYTEVARQYKPVAFAYPTLSQVQDALLEAKAPALLGVPVVGTFPQRLRRPSPPDPFVFFIGASEAREAQRIVEHLASVGRNRVAIAYWDDANQKELIEAVRVAGISRGIQIVGTHPVEPTGRADMAAVIEGVVAASPSAVIGLVSMQDLATITKGLRAKGSQAAVYGPSYIDPGLTGAEEDKSALRGVGLVQIVPNPHHPLMPLANDFRKQLASHAPRTSINSVAFRGYIAARLIVQALNRCTDPKSPACLRNELEKTRNHDLGGLVVNYTPDNHDGFSYVDIGMVSWNGKLIY